MLTGQSCFNQPDNDSFLQDEVHDCISEDDFLIEDVEVEVNDF